MQIRACQGVDFPSDTIERHAVYHFASDFQFELLPQLLLITDILANLGQFVSDKNGAAVDAGQSSPHRIRLSARLEAELSHHRNYIGR